MVVLGRNYQSTSSPGFIFCIITVPIVILVSLVWIWLFWNKNNRKYKFAPGYKYPSAVLLWRIIVFLFSVVVMVDTILASKTKVEVEPSPGLGDIIDIPDFPGRNLQGNFPRPTAPPTVQGETFPPTIADRTFPPTNEITMPPLPSIPTLPPTTEKEVVHRWVLAYFTFWNWIAVMAYFLVGILVSIARTFFPQSTHIDAERSGFLNGLFHVHQFLGELELPASWIVFFIVWCYLGPTLIWGPLLTFSSISTHGISVFIMVTDFALSGWLINPQHCAIIALWPALYSLWHMLGNLKWGFMIYPFMESDEPVFIAWTLGIAAGGQIFFWFFYLISEKLKHRVPKHSLSSPKVDVEDQITIDHEPPHAC